MPHWPLSLRGAPPSTTVTKGVFPLQAILPGGVTYAEVGGASAVSKVCAVERGGTSGRCDVWLLLWEDGISVHPIDRQTRQPLRMELGALTRYGNGLFFPMQTFIVIQRPPMDHDL